MNRTSTRTRVLLVVLALAAGLAAWIYLRPARALNVVAVPLNGTVHFTLRPATQIESIRVLPADAADAVGLDEDADPADPLALWSVRRPTAEQLEGRRQRREARGRPWRGGDEPRVVDHFRYGQNWRLGLWPRRGMPRQAADLEPGRDYIALIETAAGDAEVRFSG